jgi:BlaI family transcriptional regulator, penicillinase repressor
LPKKPTQLTGAELRLMQILWQKGRATVSEVAAELPKELDLAYNTVLTTLRILEAKGYVRHSKTKDARAYVYRPVVGRVEATRSAVRQLLGRFFGNSPEALVLNLLEDDALGEDELQRIRKLLDRRRGDTHE